MVDVQTLCMKDNIFHVFAYICKAGLLFLVGPSPPPLIQVCMDFLEPLLHIILPSRMVDQEVHKVHVFLFSPSLAF